MSKASDQEKLRQDQFRQAQKMQIIGRLASGVAHDFNNQLTVIMGYVELMQTELPDSELLQECVHAIADAASRSASLTRQLLVFSRKEVARPEIVDLNHLIREMERMLRRLIGEAIELTIDYAADPWLLDADPSHLEQVIMSLVVNARDAMPDGGTLQLKTTNVELDDAQLGLLPGLSRKSYVLLTVSDTGVGMDEATRAQAFEPFFTTKESDRGTGLGLFTVYGLVEKCQGHVGVESELGKGTTFSIHLPRREGAGSAAPKKKVVGELPRGDETILLVEDQEELRDLAAIVLRRQGYNVLVATGSAEALLISEQHEEEIALLVSDVVMPLLAGPQMASRVQKERADIKVLYMSGYPDDDIGKMGICRATMPFLRKPFMPQELICKVREVLDAP